MTFQAVANELTMGPPAEPPPKRTLYTIVDDYLKELADSEGEVTLKLDELDGELDDKALAYKHIAIRLKAEEAAESARAASFQEEVDRYKKRAAAIKKEREDMETRLLGAMKLTDKTKIVTVLGNISLQKSYSISVMDAWAETAPEQYVRTKKEPKLNVLKAEYGDKVKKLIADGMDEASARAEAEKQLPKDVKVVVSEFLKGI